MITVKNIMKTINSLSIDKNDLKSIEKLKKEILKVFSNAEFILYGSKARGDSEEFSDIDTLILLDREVTTEVEKNIFKIGFEIGLEFNVVFGIIVESKQFWSSALAKAMPLHWNIDIEGVAI